MAESVASTAGDRCDFAAGVQGHEQAIASDQQVLRLVEPAEEHRHLRGAVAAEGSQVIRISRSLFRRMLEEYPETAFHLHERLTDQLQELLHSIGALEARFGEA